MSTITVIMGEAGSGGRPLCGFCGNCEVLTRWWGVNGPGPGALGLFALAFADVTGASYTSSGDAADSMGMAVLTGAALLCYTANLYLLRRPPDASRPPYKAGATGAGKSRV